MLSETKFLKSIDIYRIHGTEDNNVFNYAVAGGVELIPQELESRVYSSDGFDESPMLLKELMDFSFDLVNQPPPTPDSLGNHIRNKYLFTY